jgi:hypothetical protein
MSRDRERRALLCLFDRYDSITTMPVPVAHPKTAFVRMPAEGPSDADVEAWFAASALFPREALRSGVWLKIGDNGRTFRVQFHDDGAFTESDLWEPTPRSWRGAWSLEGPLLRMHVGEYTLDVTASGHGVETDEAGSPPVLFRLFRTAS